MGGLFFDYGPAVLPFYLTEEEFACSAAFFVIAVGGYVPFVAKLVYAAVSHSAVVFAFAGYHSSAGGSHVLAILVEVRAGDFLAAAYGGLVVAA